MVRLVASLTVESLVNTAPDGCETVTPDNLQVEAAAACGAEDEAGHARLT